MKKLIKGVIGSLLLYICLYLVVISIVLGIRYRFFKPVELTSKEMKNEIIRQLKEKEGMAIEDYLIKQYFERMIEELNEKDF